MDAITFWLKIEYVMECAIGMQLHSHALVKKRIDYVIDIQNHTLKTTM